ncbi:hypothetical protein EJB05_41168, partial [Eragrostis curvula]
MATTVAMRCLLTVAVVLASLIAGAAASGPLSTGFYNTKCPNVQSIVRTGMAQAVAAEPRMGASILRMFFHDCFVNVRLYFQLYCCHRVAISRNSLMCTRQ